MPRIGIGSKTRSNIWREFYRLSFLTTPVMSQRQICKRIGISRVTARGMWRELAAYHRTGKLHPRIQEANNAKTFSSTELSSLRGDGRRRQTHKEGLEIPPGRGTWIHQGTGVVETGERVLAAGSSLVAEG